MLSVISFFLEVKLFDRKEWKMILLYSQVLTSRMHRHSNGLKYRAM